MKIAIKEQDEKTKCLDDKCKDLESLENQLKPTIETIVIKTKIDIFFFFRKRDIFM